MPGGGGGRGRRRRGEEEEEEEEAARIGSMVFSVLSAVSDLGLITLRMGFMQSGIATEDSIHHDMFSARKQEN
jgi:hypothetical protein